MFCKNSLIASKLAFWQIEAISAPDIASVSLARLFRLTSFPSGFPLVWILNISSRAFKSGLRSLSTKSKRPGRSRAGSIKSGLLVLASTITPLSSSIPSISVKNWETTRSVTWSPIIFPLLGTKASISSKNKIQGAACLAFLKTSRTPRSLSPMYLERSSGPETAIKLTSASLAIALAKSVFPLPGSPVNKIPLAGLVFALA